jgi:PST family polysaccharide transporter
MAAQVFTQIGSVAATIILARILSPAEFGIVAITQSILGITALLSLSGINASLVTRRNDVEAAADSYFVLTLSLASISVVAFAALAPAMAAAAGVRDAAPYLACLSLSFALSMLALVPNALLQRRKAFGALNVALIGSSGTYFLVEVALALGGLGAWSVILGQVTGSLVGLVIAMRAARFLPSFRFSVRTVRADLAMTSGMGLAQLLAYLQKNADYWAVSRFLGPQVLGSYYIAYVIPNIVRLRLTTAMRQVMLPTYAQGSLARSSQIWCRSFPTMFGVGLPILVGIGCIAEPLVAVFFGSGWQAAVNPLRILTIATIADLITMSVGTLAIAHGRLRRYLGLLLLRACTTIVLAFAAAARFDSAAAVAGAVAISAVLTLVAQEHYLARPMSVGLGRVWRTASIFALLTAGMAVVTLAIGGLAQNTPDVVHLLLMTSTGLCTFLGLGVLLARDSMQTVFGDAKRILLGR